MTGKYDDILYLPHPTSKKHPRMALIDRAAQFAPFAALTGYAAAIREAERQTDEVPNISEDKLDEINYHLRRLMEVLPVEVKITYFVPDRIKTGGSYHEKTGMLRRIDTDNHVLIFTDGTAIPMEKLTDISYDTSIFTDFN